MTIPLAFTSLKTSSISAASKTETNGRALEHYWPPSGPVTDKESEVYKMLQEKQELNEPPKQSTSFLVLQEILESEEKRDPNKPSEGVKAPITKVAASVGNAQKSPVCDKCGSGIVSVHVKLQDHHRTDCGTNLKQRAVSLWKTQSTVKSMPESRSHPLKATTWSLCSPSEPADLHPTTLFSNSPLWQLGP